MRNDRMGVTPGGRGPKQSLLPGRLAEAGGFSLNFFYCGFWTMVTGWPATVI